jgi:hypothetical protein
MLIYKEVLCSEFASRVFISPTGVLRLSHGALQQSAKPTVLKQASSQEAKEVHPVPVGEEET